VVMGYRGEMRWMSEKGRKEMRGRGKHERETVSSHGTL